MDHRGGRDWLLLLTLAVIWGSSFALIKVAVGSMPPFTITAARVGIAFFVLYLIMRAQGQSLPAFKGAENLRSWGHFLVIGMLGNGIPFTLISWGETKVTSSLAAILIGVMPVFTVVLGHLSRVERVQGTRRLAGIAAGLAGLIVLVGPAALAELGGAVTAELAIAAAAISYAATGIYARGLALHLPIATLSAGTMAVTTLIMVPAAVVMDAPWRVAPEAGAIAAVAALGVFSTGLASLAYFRLLASAGPTFASMINYLIPTIGVGLGVVWLGESVGAAEFTALALIISGIALVRNPRSRIGT